MPTLETTVNGIKMSNPFVIGSGPPGTNANVCIKAIDEGWGAVIIKTISLDASKVVNVAPRYARLRTANKEIVGWQNIELISDRPFETWIDEIKMMKDKRPDGVLIASVMEEYQQGPLDRDHRTPAGPPASAASNSISPARTACPNARWARRWARTSAS